MAAKVFKMALIQLHVGKDKLLNVRRALEFVKTATEKGSYIVALPECFNSPYGTNFFKEYAEEIPTGPTCLAMSESARENKIYLIGGSIPERDGSKLYNTCTVWSPEGRLVAKHRKLHLFDINIPGSIVFRESDVLTGGNDLTTFHTAKGKFGIGICYDLRFEEMAKLYRVRGCDVLIYPGAFNMVTGPPHFQLLAQSRALDNQVYVAAVAPASDPAADYVSYGHSMVVDPWGQVMVQADLEEQIVYADIDLDEAAKIRKKVPIFDARRTDMYDTISIA